MATKLELNKQFRRALELMEKSHKCLFITGKAGTGKSTLLSHFTSITSKHPVILAPTGVAAVNVKGQTIHGFFNFYIDVTPQKIRKGELEPQKEKAKLFKKLKTIIIDEVSMLRADLLDCADIFLRMYGPDKSKPFGGVQIILIGDLYQLPPVITSAEKELFSKIYKTPYFFSADVFRNLEIEIIELEKVYRQKDQKFVGMLNKIRNNSAEDEDIERLNSRLNPKFKAGKNEFHITLTTVNRKADEINAIHLSDLKGKLHTSRAVITGDLGREYYPTSDNLQFKAGAQIMLLNNDQQKRWVNGTIGVIESLKHGEEGEYLLVRLKESRELVEVFPYTWEVYKFGLEGSEIISEPAGSFTQFPFRLAWAVTIHKSQGKTFDNVIIDIDKGTFVAGQVYVALSRCTSFEGIVLSTPIKKQHIRTDFRIYNFLTGYQYKKSEAEIPLDNKMEMILAAIRKKQKLKITYLKANDTKSERVILPLTVGNENYMGKNLPGVKAFCTTRGEERMFRVDRILKMAVVV